MLKLKEQNTTTNKPIAVLVESALMIKYEAKEFECDAVVKSVTANDVVNLFESVTGEFGNGDMDFCFDEETSSIWMRINGVSSPISVSQASSANSKWDSNADGHSDFIVLTAPLEGDESTVFALEDKFPELSFYQNNDFILAEETINLKNGVEALDIMDRVEGFIHSLNS